MNMESQFRTVRMKNKKTAKSMVPLLIPADMKANLERISQQSGLSEADVMRLAIKRGLGRVEKMFATEEKKAA